jgi:aryl-alcohol dehydrogenase-like predicted oxidoreductase
VEKAGVSNVTLDQVRQARSVTEVVCVQNRYAVGYRTDDARKVVGYCAAAADRDTAGR